MSKDLQIIEKLKNRFGANKISYEIENNRVDQIELKYCKLQNEDLYLIGELTSLEGLYLSLNKISKIEGLERLTNLKEINLSDNKIKQKERQNQNLSKFPNLEYFDLRHNNYK